MILYIDTTAPLTKLHLYSKEAVLVDDLSWESRFNQSEELLGKIDEILYKNSVDKTRLTAIAVNTGPGSYTGVRIGVTTANFMAMSLDIPAVNVPEGNIELLKKSTLGKFCNFTLPKYQSPPHITASKKKGNQ